MKKILRTLVIIIFLIGVGFLYFVKNPELPISQKVFQIIGINTTSNKQAAVDPDCISYFDGCNTCNVSGGIIEGCTKMYCETPTEPKCLAYAPGNEIISGTESSGGTEDTETISIANPASEKCVKDGGSISITTGSDGGQMGICTFPDGRTCEERAYLRGECTFDDPATMCTMEYAPVCARVAIQCIKAPCEPVEQTFGNRCMMNANKLATYLHDGECESK